MEAFRYAVNFRVDTPKRPRKIDSYLRRITKARFQARVVGIARKNGFKVPRKDPLQRPLDLVYHTHDSHRSVPGFPDLVFYKPAEGDKPGPVIFAALEGKPGTGTGARNGRDLP